MDELVQKIAKNIKAAILIGSDAELIERAFIRYSPETVRIPIKPQSDYIKGGESNSFMDDIVARALVIASEGDVVLLAPACASMDQFISYADRGDRFIRSVEKMVQHAN